MDSGLFSRPLPQKCDRSSGPPSQRPFFAGEDISLHDSGSDSPSAPQVGATFASKGS